MAMLMVSSLSRLSRKLAAAVAAAGDARFNSAGTEHSEHLVSNRLLVLALVAMRVDAIFASKVNGYALRGARGQQSRAGQEASGFRSGAHECMNDELARRRARRARQIQRDDRGKGRTAGKRPGRTRVACSKRCVESCRPATGWRWRGALEAEAYFPDLSRRYGDLISAVRLHIKETQVLTS